MSRTAEGERRPSIKTPPFTADEAQFRAEIAEKAGDFTMARNLRRIARRAAAQPSGGASE